MTPDICDANMRQLAPEKVETSFELKLVVNKGANAIPKTVLLVDDNPSDLRVYSHALRDAGYRPITTLIGADFLGFHHNEKPALILLDSSPGAVLSVATIARVLRDVFPGSPIILFSTSATLPPEMNGIVDAFLQKGDVERLVATVRGILSKDTHSDEARAAD